PGEPTLPAPVTPPDPSTVDCSQISPGIAEARLLTRLQYDNTVRDLLGELAVPARSFPEENLLLGFGNNADAHRASLLLAERHLTAAEDLATAAVARGVDQLLPCAAGDRSEACISSFITEFGYRAFRRPIHADESTPLLELWRTANASWGFDEALQLLLQTFLQSPQLLYRTESAQSEPSPASAPLVAAAVGQAVTLDAYQIASRLSYLLWNTLPDAELFALADSGQLLDKEIVREQAGRLIDDERARGTVADFYQQWLGMSGFAGLTRDLPGSASDAFNASWRESLERFVQHTFWEEGGNVAALLGSQTVFLDAPLAGLYGMAPGEGFGTYQDTNRAGILTQPGLMALLAHADQSAPVQRGKFVREQLLCKPLPPPPPDVDTTPPDPDPGATTRERFRQHSADARCASCHSLLEGVGFGLEAYDQLGRFRTDEFGIPVDTTGNLLATGDKELDGDFDGAQELAGKFAESPQVEACLATQWFRYGMGRGEQKEDVCSLLQIKTDFSETGGDFRELLIAMATTDAFRFRALGDQDLSSGSQ
ncbi:MAG TPA: DUF1592 domain-containing protein, partial [Polyangiaceae bacterium]|nr:DUF1592 domain-containing protein [Polyangiaceae bacterium]